MFTNNSSVSRFLRLQNRIRLCISPNKKLEQSLTETTFLQFLLTSSSILSTHIWRDFIVLNLDFLPSFEFIILGVTSFKRLGVVVQERGRFGVWCFLCNLERELCQVGLQMMPLMGRLRWRSLRSANSSQDNLELNSLQRRRGTIFIYPMRVLGHQSAMPSWSSRVWKTTLLALRYLFSLLFSSLLSSA